MRIPRDLGPRHPRRPRPPIPWQVCPWLLSAQRFSGDPRTCQARRSGRTVSVGVGEDHLKDKRSPPGARGLGQSPGQHPRPASLGCADLWASRALLTTHLWACAAEDQGPAPACRLQSMAFGAPQNLDRPTGSATAGRHSLLSTGRRWPRAVQSRRGASPLALAPRPSSCSHVGPDSRAQRCQDTTALLQTPVLSCPLGALCGHVPAETTSWLGQH